MAGVSLVDESGAKTEAYYRNLGPLHLIKVPSVAANVVAIGHTFESACVNAARVFGLTAKYGQPKRQSLPPSA